MEENMCENEFNPLEEFAKEEQVLQMEKREF